MKTKTAILFSSNYGTTKQYAIKISEKLNCDIFDITSINPARLNDYDSFILCTNIISNKLTIKTFIRRNHKAFTNKKAILVVTYMNDTLPIIKPDELINESVPIFYKKGHLPKPITLFHLFHIIKKATYYRNNHTLATKLHFPKKEKFEDVDDIIKYCTKYLKVAVPSCLK